MTTLYIHIGLGKTGTTSVQRFLCDNYDRLLEEGLLYPLNGRGTYQENEYNNPPEYLDSIKHFALSASLWQIEKEKLTSSMREEWLNSYFNTINNIKKEIYLKSPDKVVISAEGLSLLKKEKTIKFFKETFSSDYDTKILIYLRRQDDWIISLYSQFVKRGRYHYDIYNFLNDYNFFLDYYNLLNQWSVIFGKKNIIVKVYEKSQFINNNLIDDFANCFDIDINQDNFKIKSMVENRTPNLKIVKIMRFLHILARKIMSESRTRQEIEDLYYGLLSDDKKIITKIINNIPNWLISEELLSLEERIKLIKEFETSNKKVAREYIHHPYGKLFDKNESNNQPILFLSQIKKKGKKCQ